MYFGDGPPISLDFAYLGTESKRTLRRINLKTTPIKPVTEETEKPKPLFQRCIEVPVNDIIEKGHGQFHYIPWAAAWTRLKEYFPAAVYDIKKFGPDQLPYQKTDFGVFVWVEVTIEDVIMEEILPVMDNRMNAIENPTARDINDSIKRCLVKAMALHGFGIQCWLGDDVHKQEPSERKLTPPPAMPGLISEPQRKRLFAISQDLGWTQEEIKDLIKRYGYDSTQEITKQDYESICNEIQAK